LLTASRLSPPPAPDDVAALAALTRTTLSPNARCSSLAVRSTVRMRSRGTDRRWRSSQPLCSSTRSAVIRYRVVRQRSTPATTAAAAAPAAIQTRIGSPWPLISSTAISGTTRTSSEIGLTTSIRRSSRRHGVSMDVGARSVSASMLMWRRRGWPGWSR
jgi:hypothetical protein